MFVIYITDITVCGCSYLWHANTHIILSSTPIGRSCSLYIFISQSPVKSRLWNCLQELCTEGFSSRISINFFQKKICQELILRPNIYNIEWQPFKWRPIFSAKTWAVVLERHPKVIWLRSSEQPIFHGSRASHNVNGRTPSKGFFFK